MPDTPSLSPVAAEVRHSDPDRFLTALFAPPEVREDLFALYAFNAEVARIREMVREPMLGLMRIQWWRDVVDGIYAGKAVGAGHPVAEALRDSISRHHLPREPFAELLDARERDMDNEPIPDRAALRAYVEATGGRLTQLALYILGGTDEKVQRAGAAVGNAWALTGLLRAVPFHAQQQRVYLPTAELVAVEGDLAGALEKGADAGVRKIVADVATEARQELQRARRLYGRPGRGRVAAFLPAVLAEGYLKRLRTVGHDPFHPRVALPRRRPVALLLHALTGRY